MQQVVTFARERLGITDISELDTVKEDVHFSLPHELNQLNRSAGRRPAGPPPARRPA